MQQTGSEPPNRDLPELLVIHTSHIHTLFRYRCQHYVHVFSHIRTRYFSEGSVQHPPPHSFRRRVRIKNKGQTTQQVTPWSNHGISGYPFYTDITRTQLIGQRHISPHSGVVRPGYTLLRHSLSQIVPCCSGPIP